MDKFRNSLFAKALAIFICLIIIMSLFIPDLTLQIIGFGGSSISGIFGGQSCLIVSVGDTILDDEDIGIIIMTIFSIVFGLIYYLNKNHKKGRSNEQS